MRSIMFTGLWTSRLVSLAPDFPGHTSLRNWSPSKGWLIVEVEAAVFPFFGVKFPAIWVGRQPSSGRLLSSVSTGGDSEDQVRYKLVTSAHHLSNVYKSAYYQLSGPNCITFTRDLIAYCGWECPSAAMAFRVVGGLMGGVWASNSLGWDVGTAPAAADWSGLRSDVGLPKLDDC